MKSNNNTIFEQLVQQIANVTTLSDREISLKVGRNAGYIAQLKSRIKASDEEVPTKFIDLLRLHFAKELKNGTSDDNNDIKHSLNEEQATYKVQNRTSQEVTMDTVTNLVESNKILANNNTVIAQAQLKLVETNAELATMVKNLMGNSTVNADQEIMRAFDAKLSAVLEVVTEVGSGKKYHTQEEALAAIGIKYAEKLQIAGP